MPILAILMYSKLYIIKMLVFSGVQLQQMNPHAPVHHPAHSTPQYTCHLHKTALNKSASSASFSAYLIAMLLLTQVPARAVRLVTVARFLVLIPPPLAAFAAAPFLLSPLLLCGPFALRRSSFLVTCVAVLVFSVTSVFVPASCMIP